MVLVPIATGYLRFCLLPDLSQHLRRQVQRSETSYCCTLYRVCFRKRRDLLYIWEGLQKSDHVHTVKLYRSSFFQAHRRYRHRIATQRNAAAHLKRMPSGRT